MKLSTLPARIVLLLPLLMIPAAELAAQEHGWHISAGAGLAMAVGPDRFADLWGEGTVFSGEIIYHVIPLFGVGVNLQRLSFDHTQDVISTMGGSFQCTRGGGRIFTSFALEVRSYLLTSESGGIYLAGLAGAFDNRLAQGIYQTGTESFRIPGGESLNEILGGKFGVELRVIGGAAAVFETTYSRSSNGYEVFQLLAFRCGVSYHL